MDLFFESDQGKIHFKGGGSGKDGFYVKAISGLGLPEKECKVAVYANQAGQEVISERDTERIITLSVDVYSRIGVQNEVRRLLQALYLPGTLTIASGMLHRRIACRCTIAEQMQKRGRQICSLTLQFTCDSPYFTDGETQLVTLFSRRDLICSNFTLPCVFTERTSKVTVVNQGCIPAEPVLRILYTGTEKEASVSEYTLGVVNHTTGGRIMLSYVMKQGETVTVDIPGRNITSDKNGSIHEALAPGSFLSEFYLKSGPNDLEIIGNHLSEKLAVSMTYMNQYIEAVV